MRRTLQTLVSGAVLALLAHAAQGQTCLRTLFSSDNGLGPDSSVFFDVTVRSTVIVTRLDMNYAGAAGAPCGLEAWTAPTTHIGKTDNQALWTRVGDDDGRALTAGVDVATSVALASSFVLRPGTYGICLVYRGAGSAYTNGNFNNQSYSDTALSLALGTAQSDYFSGSPIGNRVWNGAICYLPGTSLHAEFNASTTSGPSPLAVNFFDRSFTDDPGGVRTWAWDFDGNGTTDSTAQNPSYTYTRCGLYDVRLTVTDSQHAPSTRTKAGLIVVDPLRMAEAEFTSSRVLGAVPFAVSFADATTGSPNVWRWDFDGNGTTDSTAQNPTFTYAVPGLYTVSLTSSNGCFSSTRTKTALIRAVPRGTNRPADLLCYPLNDLRGTRVANVATGTAFPAFGTLPDEDWHGDPGTGREAFDANEPGFGCLGQSSSASPTRNWIDTGSPIAVAGSRSLTLMWWAMRDPASIGTTPSGFFFGDGSFRCYAGSSGITFNGGQGTVLEANDTAGFQGHLRRGQWNHFAIVIDNGAGISAIYENGVAQTTPRMFTPGSYVYAPTENLAIGALSSTGSSPASAHFLIDDVRIYAAALSTSDILAAAENETASSSPFDLGCAGPGGIPRLYAAQRPIIPSPNFSLVATNLEPGRPAALLVGTQASVAGALPLDLSWLLGAGCELSVLPELSFTFVTGTGPFNLRMPLPVDPQLNGFHCYAQVIVAGSRGALSNALDAHLQID